MQLLWLRVRNLAELIAKGDFAVIFTKLRKRIWDDGRSLLLRRDLLLPIRHPDSPVAFSIRPFEAHDLTTLFDPDSPDDRKERRKLEEWMKLGLESCYVAVLDDGRPTFVQWLCMPSANEPLRIISEGRLSVDRDSVLLEGAYTPPRFRRLPIMPAAMARIAEEGRRHSARWAVVAIKADNASMIRAAQHAGFMPWRQRIYRRRLFRRSLQYRDLK